MLIEQGNFFGGSIQHGVTSCNFFYPLESFFGVVGFGALSGLVSLFICGFLNVPPAKILKTCQTELMMALNIHKKNGTPASPEGVADRRLMALICGIKGDYEATLEHYDLVGMAIAANGQEIDVASIDCSHGDTYLSLARYDTSLTSSMSGREAKNSQENAYRLCYLKLALCVK